MSRSFFKFPPPPGKADWKHTGKGDKSIVRVWICQPWQGARKFSHRYKYFGYNYWEGGAPKFQSIDGDETSLFAQAAAEAARLPQFAKSVDDFGKAREKVLYNVICLDALELHRRDDGRLEPLILDASPTLDAAILDLFDREKYDDIRGAQDIVHHEYGRPVKLIREKTGAGQMEVSYKAIPCSKSPLPAEFWPILSNLHKLDQIKKVSVEAHQQAIMRLGWPMPMAAVGQAPTHQAYSPGPMPPGVSPYGAPQGGGYAPNYPPPSGPPMPQQMAPPYYGQQLPPAPPPPMAPMGMPGLPPVPPAIPPQNYAVESAPSFNPRPLPGAPPDDSTIPFKGASEGNTQTLTLDPATGKLPESIRLEDGREKCFGKTPDDNIFLCRVCPAWIKTQCAQVSGVVAPQVDTKEAALEKQLIGE